MILQKDCANLETRLLVPWFLLQLFWFLCFWDYATAPSTCFRLGRSGISIWQLVSDCQFRLGCLAFQLCAQSVLYRFQLDRLSTRICLLVLNCRLYFFWKFYFRSNLEWDVAACDSYGIRTIVFCFWFFWFVSLSFWLCWWRFRDVHLVCWRLESLAWCFALFF